MRTILDDSKTWYLNSLSYENELRLILIEGIVGTIPENLKVGDVVLNDLLPINVLPSSKIVLVRFADIITWQVINESYSNFDSYEQRDDNSFIQVLERSKYFDYVNANHGWYSDYKKGKHFRVWTSDEVIDIVACEEPIIEPINIA